MTASDIPGILVRVLVGAKKSRNFASIGGWGGSFVAPAQLDYFLIGQETKPGKLQQQRTPPRMDPEISKIEGVNLLLLFSFVNPASSTKNPAGAGLICHFHLSRI